MKTQTAPRNVTTATTESRDFTIKANGKAFRILIDGLYENKIQSIVREIWSNALDSHSAAGYPERPFSVSFPSMYNPTFSVRDYGTSLDHDEIMNLYTTVFESTKEDTNAAVGKFGLGSKSPFAYTDTFSVVAVLDGVKRMYTALISEDGVPQIHFLGEVDTDEERGIEVSFPIETRDIDAFRKAALRVSHGFDVKPLVAKQSDDEPEFGGWPELPILGEGDGWSLLSGNIEGYGGKAYAKMGCVLYPINVDAISDLTHAERRLLQSTMVIEFPVGDLEINASREALSYGPKDPTIASIRNRIRCIVNEMVKTFMDQYAQAANYWEACVLYRNHLASSNMPEAVKEHLKKNAKFRGTQLQTHIKIGVKKTDDIILPINNSNIQITGLGGANLSNAAYRFDYYCDHVSVPASSDTIIVVEDLTLEGKKKEKRVPARMKELWKDEKFDHMIWIKFSGGKEAYKALSRIKRHLKGATIKDASELPEVPAGAIAASGGGIRRPVQVRVHQYGRFDDRVDLSPEDFAKGGFFVPLERMQHKPPRSGFGSPQTVWEALKACGAVPLGVELYGAPKSLWKHFEGDQWVNIYELADATFKKTQPKKSVAKARMIERVLGDSTLRYLSDKFEDVDLDENSFVRDAIDLYVEAASAKKPAVEHVISLATAVGKRDVVEEWANVDYPELDETLANLKARYPMLEHFDNYYMRRELDSLRHYVQVCDKAAVLDSLSDETKTADAA